MPKLHYLIGDALKPIKTPAINCHCCNSIGGWGRGYVLAIRAMYPAAEKAYLNWFATGSPKLGDVQYVQVTSGLCIANMIGQEGVQWQGKIPPIRYEALEKCLKDVYTLATDENAIVTMPRIGCVLAGGTWNVIGPMVEKLMTVDTYVYTLESQKDRWNDKYEGTA